MATGPRGLLTINFGSSSLKVGIYAPDARAPRRTASLQIDRIGSGAVPSYRAALDAALVQLGGQAAAIALGGVVHRVVHGGRFTEPRRITKDVVAELSKWRAIAPDHLPQTIEAIDAITQRYPGLPQVACFDTAFHHTMSDVARRYAVPARFHEQGLRRYGFHGLSCESIVASLRAEDPDAANRRLIVAHLGGGSSLTAVNGGASVDTTMGFSPAGGVVMGTRTGDLDPGALLYLLREGGLDAHGLNQLVNHESGVLGLSGTTADMRDLLEREAQDARAATAIAVYCYSIRKALGGLVAALGGLDTFIFTGGIGEHASAIRERIIGGLDEVGFALDAEANRAGAPVISAPSSRVVIRVMHTDEDQVLAAHGQRILQLAD